MQHKKTFILLAYFFIFASNSASSNIKNTWVKTIQTTLAKNSSNMYGFLSRHPKMARLLLFSSPFIILLLRRQYKKIKLNRAERKFFEEAYKEAIKSNFPGAATFSVNIQKNNIQNSNKLFNIETIEAAVTENKPIKIFCFIYPTPNSKSYLIELNARRGKNEKSDILQENKSQYSTQELIDIINSTKRTDITVNFEDSIKRGPFVNEETELKKYITDLYLLKQYCKESTSTIYFASDDNTPLWDNDDTQLKEIKVVADQKPNDRENYITQALQIYNWLSGSSYQYDTLIKNQLR